MTRSLASHSTIKTTGYHFRQIYSVSGFNPKDHILLQTEVVICFFTVEIQMKISVSKLSSDADSFYLGVQQCETKI